MTCISSNVICRPVRDVGMDFFFRFSREIKLKKKIKICDLSTFVWENAIILWLDGVFTFIFFLYREEK